MIQECRICGCTDLNACVTINGPCYWIVDGLCSACVDDRLESPAFESVVSERARQDAKWGEQNHEPPIWIGILGEEFGELCQVVNETWFDNGPEEQQKGGYANMRAEAVQLAAVAVAFVEMLDRRYGDGR